MAESELSRLGDQVLQPGMPADAMIKTSDRTALQYLLQPLIDSFNHAWREE
jgi:HlyD family secretion protein